MDQRDNTPENTVQALPSPPSAPAKDPLRGRRRDRAIAESRWRYIVQHEPKPLMAIAHELREDPAKLRLPLAKLLKEAETVLRMMVVGRG